MPDHLTKQEAYIIIEALATVGYIEVEYDGYMEHVDDAQAIWLYNPKTKKGMSIWVSEPTDQQVFDEDYVLGVEEQFSIELIKKRDLPRYDEGQMKEWQGLLLGKTVEEAMKERNRKRDNILYMVKEYEMEVCPIYNLIRRKSD